MSTLALIRAETERQRQELEQRLFEAEQHAIEEVGLSRLCQEIASRVEAAEALTRRAKRLQTERRELAGVLRGLHERRTQLIRRLSSLGVGIEALAAASGLAPVQIRGLAVESTEPVVAESTEPAAVA